MKNNIFINSLLTILILLSFTSCDKEGTLMYEPSPTIYFGERSRTYTFTENMNRIEIGYDTVKIPVQISGTATDYDRKVIMETVTSDTLHTASADMYTIAEGYVKKGDYKGYVPVRINYSPALDDSVYKIRVKLVPNEDFPGIDLEGRTITISISNKLTEPSNWSRLKNYFGPYSNSWYRFILQKTGLSSLPYWTTNGSKDKTNPDPEKWTMTLYEVKAYAGLVKEELEKYNRKNPQNHLKHEDGPEKGKEVVMP